MVRHRLGRRGAATSGTSNIGGVGCNDTLVRGRARGGSGNECRSAAAHAHCVFWCRKIPSVGTFLLADYCGVAATECWFLACAGSRLSFCSFALCRGVGCRAGLAAQGPADGSGVGADPFLGKESISGVPSGVRVLDSLGALSDSFFADVTSAVGKIRELARQAQIDLVPQRIEEILTIGAATVAKLKELIISLRAIPGLSMDSPQPVRIKHRTWLIWVGYSVLIVALGLDAVFAPGGFNVVAFILSILMFVLCLVSRSRPTIAGWGLACLFAVTFLPMIPLPEGLGPAAIDCIIAWRLARGKFRELAALLGMLTILIIALGLNAPWNMPINLGTLALVIFASRTWKEHELDELAALRTAEELRAEFSQVLNANLAREGLALAQLIHDATSHSVGVLLIQANAALALIDKDPVASRKALALAYSVGATAQEELQRLASERDQHTRAYQLANLERLMTQLIDTGISVSVNQQIAPGCSVAPYLYRVAAEALFNAARHAPGSGVSVVFHASVLHCGVEVSNGPATIATSPTPGSGEGLTGLALELAALGGTLRYGSTPQGGFALSAWIPVTLHHGSVATIVNPTIKKHSLREET